MSSIHAAADALAVFPAPRLPGLAELLEVYEITALRMQSRSPALAAQLREQIERLLAAATSDNDSRRLRELKSG